MDLKQEFQQLATMGYRIHHSWVIPEDRAVVIFNSITLHPYTYIALVQYLSGSGAALEAARTIIHERINQIFNSYGSNTNINNKNR